MEDLSGRQLGAYRVVSPQGEGGMAAVYKAFQPAMDRYVALKILPRHYASTPEFVARFEREAKVLARLQHPHILPVFDFGEADGYTYLVMPLVTGGTLADRLGGQPLPLGQIRVIISQVGDALDYAHAQGLIHRDVKPSNVLRDERGNCLLTDFGLAKILEGAVGLTTTGGVIGTPAYMSPEQGLGLPLSGRTDIYALGVILYEMAVGRAPYLADTPMAIVVKHINDPLPMPRTLNPALPEPVEEVILKALAKDPADRYTTAGEMVLALQTAIPDSTRPGGQTFPTPVSQAAREAETALLTAVTEPKPMAAGQALPAARELPRTSEPQPVTELGRRQADATLAQVPHKPDENRIRESETVRQLGRFFVLTTAGWMVAPLAAWLLALPLADIYSVDSGLVWRMATGAVGGLSLGVALSTWQGRGIRLSPILVLASVWALWGACLTDPVLALAVLALAGLLCGVEAARVEPGLAGWPVFAVAGGWVASAMLGGGVAGITANSLGVAANIVGMTVVGAGGGSLTVWQLGRSLLAVRPDTTARPGLPAATDQPAPRQPQPADGGRGCLAVMLIFLAVAGFRGWRVLAPAHNCYKDVKLSAARLDAQLDQAVSEFSTADKIIPVLQNRAIWVTSCGSRWLNPPLRLSVKLVDATGYAAGDRLCDSVLSHRTSCGNYNGYQSLLPGVYALEFWYGDLRVDTLTLTVTADAGYQAPVCDSQAIMLGASVTNEEGSRSEPDPLPKEATILAGASLFPVVENRAVCSDTVKVRLLDGRQEVVREQARQVPLGQTWFENFNPEGERLAAGSYLLELWYGRKRLQTLPLVFRSPIAAPGSTKSP